MNDIYLSSSQICERYGSISTVTLWRWLKDAALGFPEPTRINKRRFWKLADLEAWERWRAAPATRETA